MSFSASVKEELIHHIPSAKHCRKAELAAIVQLCGELEWSESDNFVEESGNNPQKKNEKLPILAIQTENEAVAEKCFTLIQKTFNITVTLFPLRLGKSTVYRIVPKDSAAMVSVLRALGEDDALMGRARKSCCERAYLRGAFLAAGSMSDPAKSNHLEIVCRSSLQAEAIRDSLSSFDVEAGLVLRKQHYVVYIKDGEAISDFLKIVEAQVSLLEFENCRIMKEMRNSVNRRVNCEAANITKTVNAASKQVDDIELIREKYGFENLPDNLREMAEVRLEYQDAPLGELGKYLDPPVGKSGVNHRLRKLGELAEEIRSRVEGSD